MNTTALNRNNALPDLAERRAAEINAGRQRLEESRDAFNRHRSVELVEAEALALARIKADTERALAHQAQLQRDAQRAAERAAIERRAADLDAIKEAQLRQTLEQEATLAAHARTESERMAEQAAEERKLVLTLARQAQRTRLHAEREALAARRANRRKHMALAWLIIRGTSPLLVGLVALLIGTTGGWLIAQLNQGTPKITKTDAGYGESTTHLRLDRELSADIERR